MVAVSKYVTPGLSFTGAPAGTPLPLVVSSFAGSISKSSPLFAAKSAIASSTVVSSFPSPSTSNGLVKGTSVPSCSSVSTKAAISANGTETTFVSESIISKVPLVLFTVKVTLVVLVSIMAAISANGIDTVFKSLSVNMRFTPSSVKDALVVLVSVLVNSHEFPSQK